MKETNTHNDNLTFETMKNSAKKAVKHIARENYRAYESEWINEYEIDSLENLAESYFENRTDLEIERDKKEEVTKADYIDFVIGAAADFFEGKGSTDLQYYFASHAIAPVLGTLDQEAIDEQKVSFFAKQVPESIAEMIVWANQDEDRRFLPVGS